MAARSLLTLATAFAAHAGALLALGALHRPPPPAAPSTGSTEIDLDMSLPEPSRPDAPSTSAAIQPLAPAEPETRLGEVAAKAEPGAGFPERSLLPPPETAPLAPEPPSSAWSFSPFVVAPGATIDLRSGVTPDMVAPRASPSDTPPRPPTASTTGGLSEGLAEHDVALGLGHGGAVLTAAETATRADAPVEGSATFDVVVHADGTVVARVLRSEGSSADWSRVADAIGRSVDPGRMRLPAGRGWHVVLRIDAKVRLPDGRDLRSLHGPRAGVAPSVLQKQLEAKPGSGDWATGAGDKGRADQRETPPVGGELGHGHAAQGNAGGAAAQGLAQRVLPTPELSVSGKVCSAAIGLSPAGLSIHGGCSPENIGAHATRVVTGHIVSEGAL